MISGNLFTKMWLCFISGSLNPTAFLFDLKWNIFYVYCTRRSPLRWINGSRNASSSQLFDETFILFLETCSEFEINIREFVENLRDAERENLIWCTSCRGWGYVTICGIWRKVSIAYAQNSLLQGEFGYAHNRDRVHGDSSEGVLKKGSLIAAARRGSGSFKCEVFRNSITSRHISLSWRVTKISSISFPSGEDCLGLISDGVQMGNISTAR